MTQKYLSANTGRTWREPNPSFFKPFTYPKFHATAQKRGDSAPRLNRSQLHERRLQEEATYSSARHEAEKIFQECQTLIDELKEKEILLKSGEELDPQMIDDAKTARENIRANRLLRYEEMARKDEEFQLFSTNAMKSLTDSLESNQASTVQLLALLARLVALEEAKAS